MTPHITYNAGKFLYDGNEIVNPEVLPPIPMDTLLDGKAILPATLRAEVETISCKDGNYNCADGCWGSPTGCQYPRKVVRLVEVESTGILAVGEAEYEPAFPEPNKQAIDKRVEPEIQGTLVRVVASAIDARLMRVIEKAFVAGRSKQSWESFLAEIGESSQPPPQAESQEVGKEINKEGLWKYEDWDGFQGATYLSKPFNPKP